MEEGIVAGGGKALLSAMPELDDVSLGRSPDELRGVLIVHDALEAPMRQIALNAGVDADAVIDRIADFPSSPWAMNYPFDNHGYDAATGRYGDLIAAGIIDPAKVVRCALQNAASVASTLLLTEASVCTIQEKK